MQIREVMTSDVRLVDPATTLKDAAQMMREGDFGLLPIGENDRLVGTITDRDIVVRAVAQGRDGTALVRDAMTRDVKYCFADEDMDREKKASGGPYYVQQFLREQSRSIVS